MLFVSATDEKKKSNETIDDLLKKIASGDNNAFEALYIQTKADVYGFVLSYLKDTHSAQDILQDTFVKIFHAASSYVSCGKPMAWILTIAKNLTLMKLREKSRFGQMPDFEEESVESHHEKIENGSLLEVAMKVLSEEESAIVTMHAVSGLKHREIAQILDMPLSTVLSKYNRAIKKLRHELKEA